MKKYRVFIESYDNEIINIASKAKKEVAVKVPFASFVNKFYESRNFPFAGLFLPKVVAYFSPIFEYEGNSCAFLITQMKPTISTSVKNTVFPWTFCITFVNLETKNIIDSILFFGKNQFLAEDLHEFYVPKILTSVKTENVNYEPSKLLEHVCGYSEPVFRFYTSGVWSYVDTDFGIHINNIRKYLLKNFSNYSKKDVDWVKPEDLETKTKEEIESMFSSYFFEDKIVRMNKLDDFCLDQVANPPSFTQIIEKFLEK